MIKFQASLFEMAIIEKIANRAIEMAHKQGADYDKLTALMDIEAAHCNGCPLDLNKLLEAPDADFSHDVFGIRRHIDRETGQIGGCFLPRTALKV
jgi:hypothetical protein